MTFGKLRVASVKGFDGYSDTDVITDVAIAERFSTHPIAKAVHRHADEHELTIPHPDDFRELPGGGVMAEFEGNKDPRRKCEIHVKSTNSRPTPNESFLIRI